MRRLTLGDAAFRTAADSVAQVEYYANSTDYGSVHIDDLRVLQGAAVESPASP
ncbi:hypothetical protein GCM10022419_011620 [Nonomuraea rosea]|uniref:Uncharacterized protein n=1 Tax=Nonomuraea rosea TaxID=638574 RepID=A0ABP6VHR0_9ACTN